MDLNELQEQIKNSGNNELKLPRQKHITVNLGKNVKYIDICVLSNVQIGLTGAHNPTAKNDKPFRINKFKAHIAELAKNPNARVFLGGDLFYYPGGGKIARELYEPSYENQVELMAELLEPIKDKIIGAYAGTDEIQIFEKDHQDLTKMLMEKLGIPDRYCGQMAEVDFVFRNEYTNDNPKAVNMLFDHGFLVANALTTITKKTEGLQNKINGKDFYFTSHYNKLFIKKSAVLNTNGGTRMVKNPCYFVSVGGYRDFANRLTSNRNTSPSNTNNGMIRVFVVPNPDRNNIRGHDYLSEPQYKICQEFINFGRTKPLELDYDIIEDIAKLNEENVLNREAIIDLIRQKVEEINKENTLKIIEEHKEKNGEEQEPQIVKPDRKSMQKQTLVIKEMEG